MELHDAFIAFSQVYGQLEYDTITAGRPDILTPVQYNLMIFLMFNEGKNLTEIAECLSLSLPNASREVRRLTQLELIEKRQSTEDKRTYTIFVSRKGRNLMNDAMGLVLEKLDARLAHCSKTDKKEITSALFYLAEKLTS
jgi:DNA-binding MarR family transcriptional regulator